MLKKKKKSKTGFDKKYDGFIHLYGKKERRRSKIKKVLIPKEYHRNGHVKSITDSRKSRRKRPLRDSGIKKYTRVFSIAYDVRTVPFSVVRSRSRIEVI